jgi:hypothetical protein
MWVYILFNFVSNYFVYINNFVPIIILVQVELSLIKYELVFESCARKNAIEGGDFMKSDQLDSPIEINQQHNWYIFRISSIRPLEASI